jgi:hypothetical protein
MTSPTPTQRLAALEAQAFSNTAKIQRLDKQNRELNHFNQQQQTLSAKYQLDFNAVDLNTADDAPTTSPSQDTFLQRAPHLNPRPTPFYIAARSARGVRLSFVVSGMKGETLEYEADVVELAFVLQQTLKKRGRGGDTVHKSVREFLEVPLVNVAWEGREGEMGKLA